MWKASYALGWLIKKFQRNLIPSSHTEKQLLETIRPKTAAPAVAAV
jgi:hypothetical protein